MPKLSDRLERFNEPETLKMAKLGRELKAKGLDITDLSLGEPDFDTPTHIKVAVQKAVEENWSHYTPVAGWIDLKQAICDKFKRENNLDYTPEQIVVSTGAKQSIANAVLSVIDKGEEVIIPTPYWVTYSEIVKLGEGFPVMVATKAENGFKITPEELEASITEKTKLFMFSSPCNPTGSMYSKDELAALVKVFEKYENIFIMSDEIYEHIYYKEKTTSIASFNSIKDRVIIINGLSKAYAMTGYRLGYMAADVAVAKACDKIQGQFTSGATSVTQRAAIVALNDGLDATNIMLEEFKKRRVKVLELCAQIPNFNTVEPDGAFYVFPNVSTYFGKKYNDEVIENADDLCMYFLNTAHVSVVTGKAFGNSNHIRISFANSMEKIEAGLLKIKNALALLT